MYIALLFLVANALGVISTILKKNLQKSLVMNFQELIQYNFIASIFATLYFSIALGFKFEINTVTFVYALVFTLFMIASVCVSLLFLSMVPMSVNAVTSVAGGIVMSTFVGALFFKERMDLNFILSAIIMIICIVLPYFSKKDLKINSFKVIFICLINILIGGMITIITKLYAVDDRVTGANMFYLIINLLSLVITGVILFWYKVKGEFRWFTFKQIGSLAIQNTISNICSVILITILASMPLSLYSIISSSVTLISETLISRLYFKEKQSKTIYASVALAIGAIILNTI